MVFDRGKTQQLHILDARHYQIDITVSPTIFFFQAEDGIRAHCVTGVQTCALPILGGPGTARDSGIRIGSNRPRPKPARPHLFPASRRTVRRPREHPMKSILRRAGIGLAIAACFSVAALAAPSEQTRIDVRTRYGTVETVVLQDFAAGEVRSLSTAAGNPALATRTAAGVKLELAGETFDIALPDPEHAEAEAGGAGRKVIRIEKHEKAV